MKISFEIVYLETLVKRFAKLFFISLSPSGVASNKVESLIAKLEDRGPWTTSNLNPCLLLHKYCDQPCLFFLFTYHLSRRLYRVGRGRGNKQYLKCSLCKVFKLQQFLITVNSEIIGCIYYCDFVILD